MTTKSWLEIRKAGVGTSSSSIPIQSFTRIQINSLFTLFSSTLKTRHNFCYKNIFLQKKRRGSCERKENNEETHDDVASFLFCFRATVFDQFPEKCYLIKF
jgi:hypothetical protein